MILLRWRGKEWFDSRFLPAFHPVTVVALLATLVTSIEWTADGTGIIAVLLPDNRGAEPVRPPVATGPEVQVWMDSLKSPQRNFASLLQDPYEQALLEYYATGQLAVIDVRTRAARKIGAPAMIESVDPSPDGKFFRVTTMQKPFSYVVLVARLRALLRRGAPARPTVLRCGSLELDPVRRACSNGGVPVEITGREFAVLEYLLRRRGEVVPKAEILAHVWDFAYSGGENVVEVHISALRRKLGAGSIETVRGVGYRVGYRIDASVA